MGTRSEGWLRFFVGYFKKARTPDIRSLDCDDVRAYRCSSQRTPDGGAAYHSDRTYGQACLDETSTVHGDNDLSGCCRRTLLLPRCCLDRNKRGTESLLYLRTFPMHGSRRHVSHIVQIAVRKRPRLRRRLGALLPQV